MIDFIRDKIKTPAAAKATIAGWRVSGATIVFTNGCFDLIHPGHIDYLANARALGQRLVVGLNSDYSVQRLKGAHRPIMDENARALLLASLCFIDMVILFNDDTPLSLIQGVVRPDILVKGGDYTEETVVGAKEVRSWGGDVQLLSFIPGYSTSSVEEKIKKS